MKLEPGVLLTVHPAKTPMHQIYSGLGVKSPFDFWNLLTKVKRRLDPQTSGTGEARADEQHTTPVAHMAQQSRTLRSFADRFVRIR
jgi:hypothetical protein